MDIDHADHNTLDNRKQNVRVCTRQQNLMNARSLFGTSKHEGVSLIAKSGKWLVQISKNRKRIHVGVFIDEIDAAKAYNDNARELHGEFACLNSV